MDFLCKNFKILLVERNVIILSFTVLLIIIIKYAWYPILPVYLTELKANNLQVAFSYTLLAFFSTLMQFLGGILSDFFGRKKLIVIPTFALSFCYLLSANSYQWKSLVLSLVFVNSLSALQSPSFYSIIAESVHKAKIGTAFGIYQMFRVLGITIGPAIGMFLILKISMTNIFYLASFVHFICALLRMICLKETHKKRHKNIEYGLNYFKKLFNKKILIIILSLSSLLLVFNLTIQGPFMPLYAFEVMLIEKSYINLFFSLGGFVAMVYSIFGGSVIDMLDSREVLVYCVLGLGISILLWSFSTSLWLIILFFIISYIFSQSCQIAYDSFITMIAKRENRGLVIGFVGTGAGLISSLGPYLGGYLKTKFGEQSPFWAALIVALIASLIFRYVIKRYNFRDKPIL